jgi:hypothetical protein
MRRSLQFDYMAARKASSIAPGPRSPLPFQRTMSALGGGSEVGKIRKEKERRYSWRRGTRSGGLTGLGRAGPGPPVPRSQSLSASIAQSESPCRPVTVSRARGSGPVLGPSFGSGPVHAKLRFRPGPCQAPVPARSMPSFGFGPVHAKLRLRPGPWPGGNPLERATGKTTFSPLEWDGCVCIFSIIPRTRKLPLSSRVSVFDLVSGDRGSKRVRAGPGPLREGGPLRGWGGGVSLPTSS